MHRSILLFVFLVTGCSTANVYEKVSSDLLKTEQPSEGIIYTKRWIPRDRDASYEPSELAQQQIDRSLEDCVEELSRMPEFHPGKLTATVQLVHCMESKTLVLSIEEILVMR